VHRELRARVKARHENAAYVLAARERRACAFADGETDERANSRTRRRRRERAPRRKGASRRAWPRYRRRHSKWNSVRRDMVSIAVHAHTQYRARIGAPLSPAVHGATGIFASASPTSAQRTPCPHRDRDGRCVRCGRRSARARAGAWTRTWCALRAALALGPTTWRLRATSRLSGAELTRHDRGARGRARWCVHAVFFHLHGLRGRAGSTSLHVRSACWPRWCRPCGRSRRVCCFCRLAAPAALRAGAPHRGSASLGGTGARARICAV
jgi:hypothetical protein